MRESRSSSPLTCGSRRALALGGNAEGFSFGSQISSFKLSGKPAVYFPPLSLSLYPSLEMCPWSTEEQALERRWKPCGSEQV